MEADDFARMSTIYFDILGGDETNFDAVSQEDKDYFLNLLTPFVEELVDQAIRFLTDTYSVPRDLAAAIILSTTMAARMSGASSFQDFIVTEQLARQ